MYNRILDLGASKQNAAAATCNLQVKKCLIYIGVYLDVPLASNLVFYIEGFVFILLFGEKRV